MNEHLKPKIPLPQEIKENYHIIEILSIKQTGIVCSLKEKLPFSDASLILKIIPKKQYDAKLYERLSLFMDNGILQAVQEYHTKHFIYFIFPKLQSLSYLVKAGKMDFHNIETLFQDIGQSLGKLHRNGIYHMDISPGNIYQDKDGHFLLGDFSSAIYRKNYKYDKTKNPCGRIRKFLQNLNDADSLLQKGKTIQRTGSTPGFFPGTLPYGRLSSGFLPYVLPNSHLSSGNYDIYAFCMILFLLLHHGITPSVSENDPAQADSLSPETFTDLYDTEEQIDHILLKTFQDCETSSLGPDYLETLFQDLKTCFLQVKEQKTPNDFRTTVSDFEKSLFCSFTEPVIKTTFHSIHNIFHILPAVFSLITRPKSLSIPKSLLTREKAIRQILYGSLVFCGFIFLLALYHYAAAIGNHPADAGKAITDLMQTNTPPLESLSPDEKPSKEPAGSPVSILSSSSQTPKKEESSVLDISGKGFTKASFLSKVDAPEKITTLYAQKNAFLDLSPFIPFKNLKELYLNTNKIHTLTGISQLKKLEILDLSGNHLQDLSELSGLQALKILDLSGQKHLTQIRMLKNMKHLEYLILTNSNISAADIYYLQKAIPTCSIIY